jgi:glycosyltransferase involved in cell wall biosynthesis
VIPAHNEEDVIGRCLDALRHNSVGDELEIIVVANGCRDATAERARRAAPDATVVELDTASKVAALNAGDQVARVFPRAYVDADVEMSADSLRALADTLSNGNVLCAAPRMEVRLDDRPWFVRSFYRAFMSLPYGADDLVGNGVYALSEQGRARFEAFPNITADDLFVRNLFTRSERLSVQSASFLVHPPRTITGLLAIRERAYRGNREYNLAFVSNAEGTLDRGRMARVALRMPIATAVFVGVNLLARLRLRVRRTPVRWERDDSGRR